MSAQPLPAELADLIERIAHHPHGLGFLHQAYLESVAVTLGVHPFVVDAARAWLETPAGRAALIDEVRQAVERSRAGGGVAMSVPPGTPRPESEEAADLIHRAERHPLGLHYLCAGAPEEVAATFSVHPYLVFRARGMVERHEMPSSRDGSPDNGPTAT